MVKARNALALEVQGVIHQSNYISLFFHLTFTVKGLHVVPRSSPQPGETGHNPWERPGV